MSNWVSGPDLIFPGSPLVYGNLPIPLFSNATLCFLTSVSGSQDTGRRDLNHGKSRGATLPGHLSEPHE